MRVIWVHGPAGVGKSTTSWELYSQLEAVGVATGYVDIDQLGMCYPARADDPYREGLKAANIAAVLRNFAAAGGELMVVSGILDPGLVPVYHEGAVGCHIVFFRLRADRSELLRRLETRGRGSESWENILREADELDAVDLGHHVVETDGLNPAEVARLVGEKAGLCVDFAHDAGLPPESRPVSAPTAPGAIADSALPQGQISHAPGRVLWFCGPAGAGKSTVGYAAFQQVLGAGRRAAFVDLQQVGFFRGGSPGAGDGVGHGNHRLKASNIAELWSVFHSAGATDLIMLGTVDDTADVRRYRDAFAAADLTLCRLLLPSAGGLADRMRRRADGQGPDIAGDRLRNQPPGVQAEVLKQALVDDAVLDRAGIGDFSVPTEGRAVADIAREALAWSP